MAQSTKPRNKSFFWVQLLKSGMFPQSDSIHSMLWPNLGPRLLHLKWNKPSRWSRSVAQSTSPRNKAFFWVQLLKSGMFPQSDSIRSMLWPNLGPRLRHLKWNKSSRWSRSVAQSTKPRNKAFFWIQLLKSGMFPQSDSICSMRWPNLGPRLRHLKWNKSSRWSRSVA